VGNLSNDNQATLVSTGTTFHLEDHLQDVWGEVSGGVNVFNPMPVRLWRRYDTDGHVDDIATQSEFLGFLQHLFLKLLEPLACHV
jgi:hypothetical protein